MKAPNHRLVRSSTNNRRRRAREYSSRLAFPGAGRRSPRPKRCGEESVRRARPQEQPQPPPQARVQQQAHEPAGLLHLRQGDLGVRMGPHVDIDRRAK